MRSFIRCLPVLLCSLTIVLGISPRRAIAQAEVPKEVLALFDDLSDIDKLRVLNPLNLSEDQLGRIIDSIKKARDEYLKKVTAAAVPPIRDMAKEIKDLRKKLLTGGDVPSDFDKRVKKIQEDYVKQRESEDSVALKSLSEKVRPVLNATQYDKAISLAKELTRKDGKATLKGTDDQFYNLFIKGVFIDYAGIVPLLEDMKKARSAPGEETVARAPLNNRKVASK
jgi:hypothetical protein